MGLVALGAMGHQLHQQNRERRDRQQWMDNWASQMSGVLPPMTSGVRGSGLGPPPMPPPGTPPTAPHLEAAATPARAMEQQPQQPTPPPTPAGTGIGSARPASQPRAIPSPATPITPAPHAAQSDAPWAPPGLVHRESRGRWDAQNDVPGSGGVGHFGRLQFSRGRLADYTNATGEKVDPEQFLRDPELQKRVEQWHFQDIDRFIDSTGLSNAIGQDINGVTLTRDGMRNVAHLGGRNGLKRFVETGGRYNPADANGTRLSDYAALTGDAVPARSAGLERQAQPQPQPQPQRRAPAQKLAQMYNDLAIDAIRTDRLEDAAPMLQMIASRGLAAHLQAFEGDPSTPEGKLAYMYHIGQGAGMFGRDPWEMTRQSAEIGRGANAIRQTDAQERRLQAHQDMNHRVLENEEQRVAEAHEIQRLAQMATFLELGLENNARSLAQAMGYDIADVKAGEDDLPGIGPQKTVEFTLLAEDGRKTQLNTATLMVRLGKASTTPKHGGYANFNPQDYLPDAQAYARKAMGSDRAVQQDPQRYQAYIHEFIENMRLQYEQMWAAGLNRIPNPHMPGTDPGDDLAAEIMEERKQKKRAQDTVPAAL